MSSHPLESRGSSPYDRQGSWRPARRQHHSTHDPAGALRQLHAQAHPHRYLSQKHQALRKRYPSLRHHVQGHPHNTKFTPKDTCPSVPDHLGRAWSACGDDRLQCAPERRFSSALTGRAWSGAGDARGASYHVDHKGRNLCSRGGCDDIGAWVEAGVYEYGVVTSALIGSLFNWVGRGYVRRTYTRMHLSFGLVFSLILRYVDC